MDDNERRVVEDERAWSTIFEAREHMNEYVVCLSNGVMAIVTAESINAVVKMTRERHPDVSSFVVFNGLALFMFENEED